MAEKVVIDIEAQFHDKTEGVEKTQKKIDKLTESAKKLDGKKINARVSAEDSKFVKSMKRAEDTVKRFGKTKAEAKLGASDKASKIIQDVAGKANAFAGRAYNAFLNVKNSDGMRAIGEIGGGLKRLVGTAWRVTVSLVDKVTAPVRSMVGKLNSVMGLAGAGLSGYGLVVKPIQMEAAYQDTMSQFEVFLGSQDKAEKRITELTDFAGQTPFSRDQIYNASKMLEVYSPAISTPDSDGGLRMVGDIAAGTGRDYNEVAMWVGRLYSALEGGRPVGEMGAALQEMGAIGGVARNRLEELAASGKDIGEIWPQVTKEFSKYDGIMEKQSDNLNNLLLGVQSFVGNNFLKKIGAGLSDSLTPFLKKFRTWRSENKELIASWGEGVQKFSAAISGKVLNGIETLAKKFQEVFQSDEFKNADSMWDKMKVAWDKIIAEPLSEWWNGSGKSKAVEMAGNIGSGLGKGITAAVLAIFGVESDILGEGMDVGRSFIDGFKQGFEGVEVGQAIWNGISTFFKANPIIGLILGGLAAGKIAAALKPFTGAVGKVVSGVTGVTGSAAAGAVGTGVISSLIGTKSAIGGGRVITKGALAGKALSPGMAAGLGNAALMGGVAAGATAVSAAGDLYDGYNATNEYDKKHNYASSGTKVAGIAAGAAIGSIIPGVGTLIGAGVGGLVGWFASGKVADSFAGTAEEAEKYSMVSSHAAKRTEDLKRKQEALAKVDLDKRFGKMALSAEDLDRATNNLFGKEQMAKIESNTAAITTMAESYETLKSATASFDKNMWSSTIKTGSKLAQQDVDGLKESTKQFSDSSKTFLKDAQYAAESSVRLLLGNSKEADSIVKSTRDYYAPLDKALNEKTTKLNKQVDIALEDNVIMPDEKKVIDEIQTEINEILQGVAARQQKTDMELLKFESNLLGSDMDAESFGNLMTTAQEKAKKNAEAYKQAFASAMSADNLSKGQKKSLEIGLLDDLTNLDLDVGNLGLDKIKEVFKGDIGEFGQSISKMMKDGINLQDLQTSLSDLFKGENWEGTSAGISQMLEKLAPTTEEVRGIAQRYDELGKKIPDEIANFLSQIDMYEILSNTDPGDAQAALEEWWSNNFVEGEDGTFTYKPTFEVEPEVVDTGETVISQWEKLNQLNGEGSETPTKYTQIVDLETRLEESGKSPAELWQEQHQMNPEIVRLPMPFEGVPENKGPANPMENIQQLFPGLNTGLGRPVTIPVKSQLGDVSELSSEALAKKAVPKNISGTTKVNVDTKVGKVPKVKISGKDVIPPYTKGKTTARVTPVKKITKKLSFSQGDWGLKNRYSYYPTISVSPKLTSSSASYAVSFHKAARGGFFGKIPKFAAGGVVGGGPQLVQVAEEGTPEVIIPLGSHRRERAKELFRKTGEYLGIKGFAEGGIVGGIPTPTAGGGSGGSGPAVTIQEISFNVNAEGGDVVSAMKGRYQEVAEEVAGIINKEIQNQYANTPARG